MKNNFEMDIDKVGITLAGLIIGVIAYWVEPYVQTDIPGSFFIWSVGAFLGSLLLMLFVNEKPTKIALLVSLGITLAVIAKIIYDTIFVDSTSHNLAPFEIIICGIITIPSAFAGVYLGLLIKKVKTRFNK
jgi:uncharacterized membrane protein YeaQ/YmgE (transglycosylase-associated protein family)